MRKFFLGAVFAALVVATPAFAGVCVKDSRVIARPFGATVDQLQRQLDECVRQGGSYAAFRGAYPNFSLAQYGPESARALKILQAEGCQGIPATICKK